MCPAFQEMESFLPSEIARLVYGYLEEGECHEAAHMFLQKSSHLKECLHAAMNGRRFNTKLYGMNLTDLLEILSEAICFVNEHRKELKENNNQRYRLLHSFLIENFLITGIHDSLIEHNIIGSCDSSFSTTQKPRVPETITRDDTSNGICDSSQTLEGLGGHDHDINPSQNSFDVITNMKIKTDVDEDMEEVPQIEPEVEVSSPNVIHMRPPGFCSPTTPSSMIHLGPGLHTQTAPTVISPMVANGGVVGQVAHHQLVCQPFPNLLQVLPSYHPGSAIYLPQQHVMTMPQQPPAQQQTTAASSLPKTVYQTTIKIADAVQPLTKPGSSSLQKLNKSQTTIKIPDTVERLTKARFPSLQKLNMNGPKLRSIAPKLGQWTGGKVQVVNPQAEARTSSKKVLRSSRKLILARKMIG